MAEDDDAPAGFYYWVSDAQLEAFRSRTPSERLKWLEEMREFTIRVAPPSAQASWRRLRARR